METYDNEAAEGGAMADARDGDALYPADGNHADGTRMDEHPADGRPANGGVTDGDTTDGRGEYHPLAVRVLKALVVVFEVVCVAAQVCLLLPVSTGLARSYHMFAPLRTAFTAWGVWAVACFEVALVGLWHLLNLARDRDVFSGGALRWVNLIIRCAAVEAVVFVLALATMDGGTLSKTGGVAQGESAAALVVSNAVLVGGLLLIAAFLLLMVVMRSLLRQAIAQHDELQAVI